MSRSKAKTKRGSSTPRCWSRRSWFISSDAMSPRSQLWARRAVASCRPRCGLYSGPSGAGVISVHPRRRGADKPRPLCPSVQAGHRADVPPVRDHMPDGVREVVAGRDRHPLSEIAPRWVARTKVPYRRDAVDPRQYPPMAAVWLERPPRAGRAADAHCRGLPLVGPT
jgi:hypothetical protein